MDKALTFLFFDLMEEVLQRTEHPGEFADFLTQKIAEIIGVKTVVMSIKKAKDPRLQLTVYPPRRQDWLKKDELLRLIAQAEKLDEVRFFDTSGSDPQMSENLISCEVKTLIVIPLSVGGHKEGVILLLDLFDTNGIAEIIDLLEKQSGVFAIISRNAYLYSNMEQEVRERTIELDRFFDQPQNIHLIANIKGVIERVNEGFHSILGYKQEDIAGLNFLELIHPDDRRNTLREMARLDAGETIFSFSNRYRHKNGPYIWLDWSAVYSRDIQKVFAVARDVTAQKEAEENVRIFTTQQSRLLAAYKELLSVPSPQALFVFLVQIIQNDIPDSIVLGVSVQEEEEMTTLEYYQGPAGSWLTKVIQLLGYDPQGSRFKLLPEYRDYMVIGKLKEFANGLTEFSGSEFPNAAARALEKILRIKKIHSIGMFQAGSLFGAVHIFLRHAQHIEHPEYIELLVNQASLVLQHKINEEEINRDNQSKDKLFSIIGHDLRGPLGQIINFSELIQSDIENLSPDKIRSYGAVINESSERLLHLLDDLLIWARSQSGRLEVKKTATNLQELVEDGFSVLQLSAQQKNIKLINRVSKDLSVFSDPNAITMVIRNLVNNALKFSHPGSQIKVSARTKKHEIWVTVKDSGIGMSPEQISHLFSGENRQTTKGTTGEKGSGLGLEICQYYITAHQGRIWAESKTGKGSTFTFTLPDNKSTETSTETSTNISNDTSK